MMNQEELIAFEDQVAALFNSAKIRAPVHLYSGNEAEMIEVFKDVVFRAAPVTEGEALRMLDELKSKVVLDGVRGKPPVDRAAIAKMVSAVSRLGAAAGPRLAELDLNPVLAGPQGATAVDWLMVFD